MFCSGHPYYRHLGYPVIVLKLQNPRNSKYCRQNHLTSKGVIHDFKTAWWIRSNRLLRPSSPHKQKDVWPPYTTNKNQDYLRCIPLPSMSLLFLYLNPKLMSVAWCQTWSQWIPSCLLFIEVLIISPLCFSSVFNSFNWHIEMRG